MPSQVRLGVTGLAYNVATSGGAVKVYHRDHLGSIRELTDSGGHVTTIYLTDEYGVPTAKEAPSRVWPSRVLQYGVRCIPLRHCCWRQAGISSSKWAAEAAREGTTMWVADDESRLGMPSAARQLERPRLRTLRRVVPIAQTYARSGTALTLLSLETYEDGFRVYGRVKLLSRLDEHAPGRSSAGAFWRAAFRLDAQDNRGGVYSHWKEGSGGVSGAQRFHCRYAPAPDPAAHELGFRATTVRWLAVGPALGVPREERVLHGPWTFDAELSGDGRQAAYAAHRVLGDRLPKQAGRTVAPTSAAGARFTDLVGVVGVGRGQEAGGAALTITSLELYEDGFFVRARLRLMDGRSFKDEEFRPSYGAHLVCGASDDRGGGYASHDGGGQGGGDADEQDHVVGLTPALNPAARELRLSVSASALQARRHGPQPAGPPRTGVTDALGGPWTFTISLPPRAMGGPSLH